jgi:hypothetical protein
MNRTCKLRALVAAVAAGLVCASPAGAQEDAGENALRRGASSVMAGVAPEAGVGFWSMLSDRTAVGLVGGVQRVESVSGDSEHGIRLLTLSPQVKRYWRATGPILPYAHGSLSVSGIEFGSGSSSRQESRSYGAGAAVGLDWFPVRRISVGGHGGVALSRAVLGSRDAQGEEMEISGWSLGTFTTAIRVHLYL